MNGFTTYTSYFHMLLIVAGKCTLYEYQHLTLQISALSLSSEQPVLWGFQKRYLCTYVSIYVRSEWGPVIVVRWFMSFDWGYLFLMDQTEKVFLNSPEDGKKLVSETLLLVSRISDDIRSPDTRWFWEFMCSFYHLRTDTQWFWGSVCSFHHLRTDTQWFREFMCFFNHLRTDTQWFREFMCSFDHLRKDTQWFW
jgi:hypothetical protein